MKTTHVADESQRWGMVRFRGLASFESPDKQWESTACPTGNLQANFLLIRVPFDEKTKTPLTKVNGVLVVRLRGLEPRTP